MVVLAVLSAACSNPSALQPVDDAGADTTVADDVLGPTVTTIVFPTNPPLPTLPPTTAPPPPVGVLAVGNLSDCGGQDREVADLIAAAEGTVLAAGDLTTDGSAAQLDECFLPLYADKLDRFLAVPGNNDLATAAGAPFYEIAARTPTGSTPGKGWFVTTIGAWQVIGLNSQCADVGGCGVGSEQYLWLDDILRNQPSECRAAFWHDARFTSSHKIPAASELGDLYGRLHGAGTDLIISAGPANYERLGPLRPNGDPDEDGVMNFNVGTGSDATDEFGEPKPGSRSRLSGRAGLLSLMLSADGYTWEFVATPSAVEEAGSSIGDAGSGTC